MAYIGNTPGVSSQRYVDTFTPTTDTTIFTTTSGYALGYADVYLNGNKLIDGTDYTASNGTTVVLTEPAISGDVVEVVAFKPRGLSDGYTKAEADAAIAANATPSGVSDKNNTSTGYFDLPAGTTAQRPESPNVGYVRYNTSLGFLEQYTNDGWQGIAPPPVISSVDVNNLDESATTQTIVITGASFDATATALLVDANGNLLPPTTSTRNSSSQITIVYSGDDVLTASTPEPLSVRVSAGSGLNALLENVIAIDASPVWTSSGNQGTVYEDQAMSTITLSASDPEGESVTYALTGGALPTGLSLSSAGAITGTPNANGTYSAAGVQHNFTVTASDGTGNTTPQNFYIIRKWMDGSTSAQAAASGQAIYDLGITTDGTYWLKPPNGSGTAFQAYVLNSFDGGGWVKFYQNNQGVTMGSGAYNAGSTWTTAADNLYAGKIPDSDIHALQANGVNTGFLFSTSRRDDSKFRYWRYVEGSTITGHHPRVSRIMMREPDGTEHTVKYYLADNCSDQGTYQVGTTSTYDAGTPIRAAAVGAYTTTTAVRNADFYLHGSNDGSTWTTVMNGQMSATGTCGMIWGTAMNTGPATAESVDYDPFLNFSHGIGKFELTSGTMVNWGTDRDPDSETYDMKLSYDRSSWNSAVRYPPHVNPRCDHFGSGVSSWYSDHNTDGSNSVVLGTISSQAGMPICWTIHANYGMATNLHFMGADPTYNPARSDSGAALKWGYTSASSVAFWIK